MDIPTILQALGGDVMAVIVVALGAVVVTLWRRIAAKQERIDALYDARLNDVREHGRELREVADNSTAAINGLTRVLEDRRNV